LPAGTAKARTREERFAKVYARLETEYRNYSDSVLILNGLASFFQSSAAPARFVGVNLPLKRLDVSESQPPRPDLLVQGQGDTVGSCFELKWSLPYVTETLKRELLSCGRYSQPRSGWKTQDGTIPNVEVFLVAPRDRCKRAIELIDADKEVGALFSKNVALLSWDFSRTTDKERLFVLKVAGSSTTLNGQFSPPGLDLGRETLTETLAKIQFYGAKPPLHYIMERVYLLATGLKTLEVLLDVEVKARTTRYMPQAIVVTARELHAEQSSYFPPWERADQELPQIRLGWIQEALVGLVRINMAIPVVAVSTIDKSGTVFWRSSQGWMGDRSHQFLIPIRSRGADLKFQIIKNRARYLVDKEGAKE
jgi:hypothetical protein